MWKLGSVGVLKGTRDWKKIKSKLDGNLGRRKQVQNTVGTVTWINIFGSSDAFVAIQSRMVQTSYLPSSLPEAT